MVASQVVSGGKGEASQFVFFITFLGQVGLYL